MDRSGIIQSLCQNCCHEKDIVSGKGSRFLLCELSQTDFRFAKYPPQPVVRCVGYEGSVEENEERQ